MYEYHGWFTFPDCWNKPEKIKHMLHMINDPYPVSVDLVNSQLHISISGNPNRNLGCVEKIIDYLVSFEQKIYGVIYINDSTSTVYDRFKIIKVVRDEVSHILDSNFSLDETKSLFD